MVSLVFKIVQKSASDTSGWPFGCETAAGRQRCGGHGSLATTDKRSCSYGHALGEASGEKLHQADTKKKKKTTKNLTRLQCRVNTSAANEGTRSIED
jgi:hypothetical protein